MKHGFKAQAERLALSERDAIGLSSRCRLDPRRLAAAKNIGVVDLSRLPGVTESARHQLQVVDPGSFSAAAVAREQRVLIVVNDAHPHTRQANSVAHELAHILLGHRPTTAFSEMGGRNLSKDHEDEADWLAGCLLVPRHGIPLTLHDCGHDLSVAAAHYGVSVELMRWRYNVTTPRRFRRAA